MPKKHDADIIIPIDPPWELTEPLPEMVGEVVDAEHKVLRDRLVEVISRLPRTPINVIAALFAVADVSAWVLVQAEERQALLPKSPPGTRIDFAATFDQRFRTQLARQRRDCARRRRQRASKRR